MVQYPWEGIRCLGEGSDDEAEGRGVYGGGEVGTKGEGSMGMGEGSGDKGGGKWGYGGREVGIGYPLSSPS